MRFTGQQDYNTVLLINKELVNAVVDVIVVIYKINVAETATNIYGEAISKESYTAIRVPCLVNRQSATTFEDMGTINVRQPITFAFLRQELKDRNIYPEIGDIVGYDNQYFQIDIVNETRQYAGQVQYNHDVVCEAHLTNKRDIQIDRPNV